MKKSLVALAVMGAMSGAAFAQSNVQVYGIVDVGIERTSSGGVDKTTVGSGLQSSSRIGFKGTEDLGNGLTAQFVLEQGIKVDDGSVADATSNAFGRQAWVGVGSKDFGGLRLGRQNTPIRGVIEAVDPFALGSIGNSLKVLGNGQIAERTSNAVTYVSPNFKGFQAQVQYGMGETAQSSTTNGYTGLSATYANGPVMAAFAYAEQKTDLAPSDKKASNWILGGTYDFGVAKAHVAYAEGENKDAVAGTSLKGSNYLVGVSAPFGAHTVMASYIQNKNKDVASADSDVYALGYTYSLSKRTNVYASYSHTSNDANVKLNGATANGDSADKYSFGIRHQF